MCYRILSTLNSDQMQHGKETLEMLVSNNLKWNVASTVGPSADLLLGASPHSAVLNKVIAEHEGAECCLTVNP